MTSRRDGPRGARSPRTAELTQYVERSYELIPLNRWDAVDRRRKRVRQLGKAPVDAGWRTRAYSNEQVLRQARAGSNVGVRLRPTDLVLDVDPRNFPEGRNVLDDFALEVGLDLDDVTWLGHFVADAANEPGHLVESSVYTAALTAAPRADG